MFLAVWHRDPLPQPAPKPQIPFRGLLGVPWGHDSLPGWPKNSCAPWPCLASLDSYVHCVWPLGRAILDMASQASLVPFLEPPGAH